MKERMGLKIIQRNKGWKLSKFGKRHTPMDARNWVNPKQDTYKEIHAKTHQNKISKN